MNYQLTQYNGEAIEISLEQMRKIAELSGMVEITDTSKRVHFFALSNLAGGSPTNSRHYKTVKELGLDVDRREYHIKAEPCGGNMSE